MVWLGTAVAAANFMAWYFLPSKIRWLNFIVAMLIALVIVAIAVDNAASGCYPWSPKEVEFHQGMTICPSQSARFTIEVPVR